MNFTDGCVLTVTLIAAITDLTCGKVFNKLTYPAATLGLLGSAVLPNITVLESVTGLVASFAIYYALHKLSGVGAGDVKLMAAVGAFKGFVFVIYASFYVLCIGSALGLIVLAMRGRLFPALRWVFSSMAHALAPGAVPKAPATQLNTVPFAPMIFLGVAYAVCLESRNGPFALSWWW
jgi:prepilin peptidase CpaA